MVEAASSTLAARVLSAVSTKLALDLLAGLAMVTKAITTAVEATREATVVNTTTAMAIAATITAMAKDLQRDHLTHLLPDHGTTRESFTSLSKPEKAFNYYHSQHTLTAFTTSYLSLYLGLYYLLSTHTYRRWLLKPPTHLLHLDSQ
jgi:hypothetical protein